MSEENNGNSSKIKSDKESIEDDLSPITTSENIRENFIASQECIVDDTSSTSIRDEKAIDPSIPTMDENILKIVSKVNSKMDTTSAGGNSSVTQTTDSKICSTIPTTITSEYTTEGSTESPYTTTESYGTSSSEGYNQYDIEESILKMIKHIEEEIESEEHIGANESRSQNIEIKIKTSRVMVAIEQTIEKLEIAFCLPYIFVENMHDMNVLCGDVNMSRMMNEYCKIRDAEDMDICRFQPAVINCINSAFEAGFSEFVDLHRKKLHDTETRFLSTMVQFKCMAEWQMGMSAIKAMNKEKTLHKMWTSNEKIKSRICEMEEQYDTYRNKLQEMLNEKNKTIATHNQTIADLEKRNTNDINAEIFRSNKAMRRVCLTSEEKQKILSAELQQVRETYEKLVQSNLLVEKRLRDQKSKTRQKLQAVLHKYDTGVGERFTELLRIRDDLEEETVLYENKVKEFQLQELEYNQIMADKAEVDAKVREEKLLLFMMNRSARIIQRAYKKMMKKRKKGKKGKKGKKAKKARKPKK